MKNYLPVGNQYTDTEAKKKILDKAISEIEWHDKAEGKVTLGFMQGAGLKSLIKQLGHNVDRYGYAGYFGVDVHGGFVYGIRNNYSDGDIKQVIVYAIDNGVSLTPVMADENPSYKFDINRKDFYLHPSMIASKPFGKHEITKKRLQQIADLGMEEVGVAQFGIPGIVSGLYIERIWNGDDKDFKEYLEYVTGLITSKEL